MSKYQARVITADRIYSTIRSNRKGAEKWVAETAATVAGFENVMARQIVTQAGKVFEY